MKRAARFAVGKVAKELNDYYASLIYDVEQEEQAAVDQFYEDELYELEFGKNSRIGWLQENEGLSLTEAVAKVREENLAWERETYEWLQDPKNWDSEIYSDVFKDYYGYRPRGYRPCGICA